MEKILFTSESVTEGHPDKIADRISDSILDEILTKDKNARVACETTVTTGLVLVSGEISTTAYVDIQGIVRKTVAEVGYNRGKFGFDSENLSCLVAIDPQSPDIAQGVNEGEGTYVEQGAGDQGIMFGFATNETEEFMPLPIVLAHKLTRKLSEYRKTLNEDILRPDGKAQVTVEYNKNNKVKRIDAIVVSTQHSEEVTLEYVNEIVTENVIKKVIDNKLIDENTKIYINPTGRFVIGGPKGDAGLTGRKIIVDTYGGYSRHGGGAFSGKDPSKVDRSAAYATRYVAKNIVASGLADKCEIQISYAIGLAEPTSIMIETFGTNKIDNNLIIKAVRENFDLRPKGIINMLNLLRPIYKQTSSYGHFGRVDLDLPWEKLDKVNSLKKYLK